MSHPALKAMAQRRDSFGADRPQQSRAPPHLSFTSEPMTLPEKPQISVLLAAPRGFCAGVDRAIQIVEQAIRRWGAPVYVRHEIVHNRHVVERLEALGAVFVEELDDCPADRPVIFSAHGVPKAVPAEARAREMIYVDATCPLVSKVHVEAQRQYDAGHEIVLIGHAGHPEVIGTMGQLPAGAITLLETVEDAERFEPRDPAKLSFVTQTTLSVDDTAEMVGVLQRRFPGIAAPHKEDICYATTNRQDAVKAMAEQADLVLVIGSPKSSNSVRLVEVAKRAGARDARLVGSAEDVDWSWFTGVRSVGVTAGASAPEDLVEALIGAIASRFDARVEEVRVTKEDVVFKLPRVLAE
jgi:4-hydroxy-3-methylbut-2-enyl diphosphate reductase